MTEQNEQVLKVTWKGWLSLAILVISLSGIFTSAPAPWKALDFMVLTGQFGEVAKGIIFTGKGGLGAKDGFMFALTLIPTVMFALGSIQVAESLGALRAAERLFQPLLKPLLGIPGVSGLAFVSSFTSTDVGAVMTKGLVEDGLISDKERTVFASYQFAGSAFIVNTFGTGGPLLPISVLPIGVLLLVMFISKIIGTNIVRFYLNWHEKKAVKGLESHG
ncbi:MAG: hypothetical protein E6713_09685 [Sporomusaceae bacterium]|nr:hypothetical protein [Sporomusaceae bacterium]